MISMILFGISVFILISKLDVSDGNMYNLVTIVSSLISFTSVIISIPLIITKYLFSSKEDKRIADIILHTQKHDLNGKKIIRHIVDKELTKIKDSTEKKECSEMMDLVNETIKKARDSLNPSIKEQE